MSRRLLFVAVLIIGWTAHIGTEELTGYVIMTWFAAECGIIIWGLE